MSDYTYTPMCQFGEDTTSYRQLTDEHVTEVEFDGKKVLKVDPKALTHLAREAFMMCLFTCVAHTSNCCPRH